MVYAADAMVHPSLQVAVLTPVPPHITENLEKPMRAWPALRGVSAFYLCGAQGPGGIDASIREAARKLPNCTLTTTPQPREPEVPDDWQKMYRIAHARNKLLEYGRRYDYALMLDADVEPTPDLVERLVSHRKDIVSPLIRVPTNIGSAWGFGYFKDGSREGWGFSADATYSLQKVSGVCTSAMLLSKRIMNDLRLKFWPMKLKDKDIWVGEDHGYCYHAGLLGYEVYVDSTMKMNHFKLCWNHRKLKLELRPLTEYDQ